MWSIMIIARDFEEIVQEFLDKTAGCTQQRTFRSKYEVIIYTALVQIKIYAYNGGEISCFRGMKADIIYLEEELYNDNELRNAVFIPMSTLRVVRPLKDIRNKLGWLMK